MKKISTLIAALFVTITTMASPNSTRLTISITNEQSINIMIDGRLVQTRRNDNTFTNYDIPAGYHSVRIYRQRGGGRRSSQNHVLYSGNVYVKRGYHMDITINRFGKAFVDEQVMSYGSFDDHNDWDNHESYDQPMDSRSFEQLKQVIANESFDNTKMNIARSNISSNFFSAAQAKQIVMLFNYENSKLEIAKYLYRYTLDKNNYVTVFDAFTFSTSKDELSRFIQQYR